MVLYGANLAVAVWNWALGHIHNIIDEPPMLAIMQI
jgi:hypothetical protein